MEVPRKFIDGYDEAMRSTIESIQGDLRRNLALIDYSQPTEAVRREVVKLMDAYCGAASNMGARISAEFYSGLREMATGKPGFLSLQTGRSPQATEQAVRAFINSLVDGDYDEFEGLLMERIELEAKKAAAYNTIDNVRRDPDKPRFARVPQGEKTCDFCIMLASRGPVYLTEESAGAFTKFHANCDCKVVPFWGTAGAGYSRRTSAMTVEGYDPDAYYVQYRDLLKNPKTAARMKRAAENASARRAQRRRGV
jgi:hypothetical protein